MNVFEITKFLQTCGIKYVPSLVKQWMIAKVKPKLQVSFEQLEELLETDAVLGSSSPKIPTLFGGAALLSSSKSSANLLQVEAVAA